MSTHSKTKLNFQQIRESICDYLHSSTHAEVKLFIVVVFLSLNLLYIAFLSARIDALHQDVAYLEKENGTLRVLVSTKSLLSSNDEVLKEKYQRYVEYMLKKFEKLDRNVDKEN